MTLAANRPLWRETGVEERGRPIIVGLDAFTLSFRLKGTRTTYCLPIKKALLEAEKLAAERLREERKEKRKERRRKK